MKTNCWFCKNEIDDTDNFCRHCGRGQGSYVPWYYKVWGSTALFFAIGPLNLIYVWKSPAITLKNKWLLTALSLFLTFVAVYLIYYAMNLMFTILNNAMTGNF